MQRVVVVGPPGAGKSTFACQLATRTQLPLIHLDQLLWQPGWIETPKEAFDAAEAAAASRDRWIIDGTYIRSLPARIARADTIVWLDVERLTALRRVMWRTLTHFGRARPDMTPNCPERFELEFLRYIWSFQTRVRPRLQAAIDGRDEGTQLHVLRTPRETHGFIASL